MRYASRCQVKEELRAEIAGIAADALDRAERIWEKTHEQLTRLAKADARMVEAQIATLIPGYKTICLEEPHVDTFVALMADLRNSTDHLLTLEKNSKGVTQLQRVFYETSALLPVEALVIEKGGGSVTEYLGDGVLGLFRATDDEDIRNKCIYAANNAAQLCVEAVETVVSPMLRARYDLPGIRIGVGMAISPAIVTAVGLKERAQPKAIGECVYRAAKWSAEGSNEVIVDERLRYYWPKEKDGVISFAEVQHSKVKGLRGYRIIRKAN